MTRTQSFLLAILPLVGGCVAGDDSGIDTSERVDGNACMPVEADAACPDPESVEVDDLTVRDCGSTILEVTGAGTYQDNVSNGWDTGEQPGCCYPVIQTPATCDYGRPLLVEGEARLAELSRDTVWAAELLPQDAPEALRAELVKRWTRAALDEHASVAAFAKVSLDLMRFGAPPELLARTHQAATDEIQHARLGFALASAFAGHPVSPGAYPLEQVPMAPDLVALAVEAALEGCIGETLASLLAFEGAERAQDPVLREVMGTIARDEQQHSLLAWSTVRWAVEAGGEPVRRALAEVFERAAQTGIAIPQAPEADLSAWGILSHADSVQVARACLNDVILPAARALLSPAPTPELHA